MPMTLLKSWQNDDQGKYFHLNNDEKHEIKKYDIYKYVCVCACVRARARV